MKNHRTDTYNWRIAPDMLRKFPFAKKDRRLRSLILQNIIVLAVGIVVLAGLILAAEHVLQHKNIGALAAVALFLVIPICTALMVLNFVKMLGSRYLVITPTTVSYRRRRWGIVTADWTEPLTGYEGIRGVIVRTGKESLEQIIELVHTMPGKTIRFYRKKSGSERGRIQLQLTLNENVALYATALHLRALISDEAGNVIAVSPKRLVASVGDLVRQGLLTVEGWEETPPIGLMVKDTPEGKCITFLPRRRKGILALEGFLAVLFIAAHFLVRAGLEWNEDAESPLVLLVLCVAAMLWELFCGRRLYITASSLRRMPLVFGMELPFREQSLALREVRSVTVPNNTQLALETGSGERLEAYVSTLFRKQHTTSPVSTQLLEVLKEMQRSKVVIAAPGKTWSVPTERPEHARWIRGLILTFAAGDSVSGVLPAAQTTEKDL